MADSTDSPAQDLPGNGAPAGRRLAGISDEITALAKRDPEALKRRVADLTVREQAELALRLPPAKRLEMLLHAPRPMRLVRALPDGEFYLTVREVGPADAAPLIGLCSASQVSHLFDLESWRGDRFDADRAGAWAALLLEAGEPAVRRFLRNADPEVIALLFAKWIRVEQIEYEDGPDKGGHGQGEAGTEEGFMTPDGEHRFKPTIEEHGPAIGKILKLMFEQHPDMYRQAIWSSMWELPSELEEQALQWRQSRLEEHGFPTDEEALSVFEPPSHDRTRPAPPSTDNLDVLPAGRSPLRVSPAQGLLVSAIDRLDDEMRETVLSEMIGVANRLLVAERADTGDPEAHRGAVLKAGGYIEIALKLRGAQDRESMTLALREQPMLELFREGYAEATKLQRRARELVATGWAAQHERALELLDSPIRERAQALLEPRPSYFAIDLDDGTDTGGQREFRSLAELDESRVALEVAELFGRLVVEHLSLDVAAAIESAEALDSMAPRFSTFLLTSMAWLAVSGELRGDPLPTAETAAFLRTVASRRTASPDAPSRAFGELAAALARRAALSARETAVLEAFGRYCLQQLSDECGNLDPGVPPDPRAISCLLLTGVGATGPAGSVQ